MQGERDGSVEEDVAAQLAAGTLEETSSVWGYGSRRGGRAPHHPSSGHPSTSPVPQGRLAGPASLTHGFSRTSVPGALEGHVSPLSPVFKLVLLSGAPRTVGPQMGFLCHISGEKKREWKASSEKPSELAPQQLAHVCPALSPLLDTLIARFLKPDQSLTGGPPRAPPTPLHHSSWLAPGWSFKSLNLYNRRSEHPSPQEIVPDPTVCFEGRCWLQAGR